ncbi:unnamed protein product [Clavelina lepadiformis]|uniref:unspecific monooxygenase n=1 Tax=Clavelina lepadiformis TaxID=159417 RepID=A0ABP0GZV0_CLALP
MEENCTSFGIFLLLDQIKYAWSQPTVLMLVWIIVFGISLVWLRKAKSNHSSVHEEESNVVDFKDLPSPMGLPILGNILQLGQSPHTVFTEWAKTYGSLFRIKLGFQDILVVTGGDTIRTALAKNSVAFAGRPHLETSQLVCQGLSLTFSDYSPDWNKQKSSAQLAMALYTTGRDADKRSVMESSATTHASNLAQQLLQEAGNGDSVVTPRDHVLANMSNAICTVCFGQIFDINDPKLRKMLSINRNFDGAMGASQPVNFFPFLKYVPVIGLPFKNLVVYMNAFWDFVSNLLESHWSTYDDDCMRDMTDCLYHESEKQRKKRKNNNEPSPPFIEKNGVVRNGIEKTLLNGTSNMGKNGLNDFFSSHILNGYSEDVIKNNILEEQQAEEQELELRRRIIYGIGDIFGAGYDTLFTCVDWSIFYLAAFPDKQEKIFEETQFLVTFNDDPSLRCHGARCPYTQAWIYELVRHTSLVPLLLPHATTKETILNNCCIPKGTTVYFNVWQAHRDPEVWDNPEEFRPERFLKEKDGSISLAVDEAKKVLGWGAGKRKCLGETLSRHQLFAVITTVVNKCVIKAHRPGVEPALPWPVDFGLTLKPKPYRVKITPR